MFEPCYEHCYLRYGKQYTKECDDKCNYAKAVKENKELAENAIIFPQTIGDITFYSKAELFEWVENMQKEFCSPPSGFFFGNMEKPIKVTFEGDIAVERNGYDIEVRKKFDCSYMSDEEWEDFKERLKEQCEEVENVVGDTIRRLSNDD